MDLIKINKYLQGDPEDLIEVYYLDMNDDTWRALFNWIESRVSLLECQHGRLPQEELDCESFLSGSMVYIAVVKVSNGIELSLSIIEEKELTIDIEIEEINAEESFALFVDGVEEIAKVISSKNYLICPEFKKNQAFYINGKFE